MNWWRCTYGDTQLVVAGKTANHAVQWCYLRFGVVFKARRAWSNRR